jgi:putative transposase
MKETISKQQWLEWINEQEQSDLSIAAFCRNKTINADNFYYHIGQHRKKSLPTNSGFIRAQLVDDSALIKNPPTMTLCVGRSRLQLSTEVSPEWLSTLMISLA